MNRKILFIGGAVVIGLVAVFAIAFDFDPQVISSPLIDQPAPLFRLVDLDGQVVDLEQLRGDPVVINFWASWCLPCIAEHPLLRAASDHYRGRVHFLGVIYQDQEPQIRRFMAERGSWGPALKDPDGKVAIAYGVYGAPETFFVDSEGVIRDKVVGALQPDALRATLEGLL